MGTGFFKSIPRKPGVYFFRDEEGDPLYVGKAKDLKLRLASYRRAKPGKVSRKIIRMLERVHSLDWEECPTEKEALLLENAYLRDLDPEFNVTNTSPERYYFVGLQVLRPKFAHEVFSVRFKLTRNAKDTSFKLFGCFRNGRGMKAGYSALLRLIWATQCHDQRFAMPSKISRRSPPYNYETPFPKAWLKALESFLDGKSLKLLEKITLALLENLDVPDFMRGSLQTDIEIAKQFYNAGPRSNRRLKIHHKVQGEHISQFEIDDLLVHEAARRGRVEG